MPGLLRTGVARIGVELKTFARNRQAMFFTFSLPVLFLVLFGAIFHGEIKGSGVDFRQYFVAGMMATGIFGTGFANLAIRVAMDQDDGTLKRLAGTPMPKGAYFIGKLGSVVVAAAVQSALMLTLGVLLYGLKLPTDPTRLLTFAWVFVLGVMGTSLLGIAYSRIIKKARAAPAVVQPPYLVLQFISGVFFYFGSIPGFLRTTASLFPLKWMAQGLRSVFLPAAFAAREPGGAWNRPLTALILGAWVVGGFARVLLTFRWRGRGDE